jgi:VIT1/CCC1 family predicted Fe2+/Mn2+ transporter
MKNYELLSFFVGSGCFIGTLSGIIFGPSQWQAIGTVIAAAVLTYAFPRIFNK